MDETLRTTESLTDNELALPVFTFRPKALLRAAGFFKTYFKGTVLYAIKTNPDPKIIKSFSNYGITSFDVASLHEIELVHGLIPQANLYFMHPIKSRNAISKAYNLYNVRHFSLDCEEELLKIIEETNEAGDLNLHIRLSIPNSYSELNLSEKFGVNLQDAPKLLKKASQHAAKIGICFHVGSQCMHPDAYRIAMRMAKDVIKKAKVKISYFNVGGGFPSIYPGMIPVDMNDYFEAIADEFSMIPGHTNMTLLAEPGRALVAECMSLIVRVELRKNNVLYINEGTYGSLFDAGTPKFIFPVRLLRNKRPRSSDLAPFSFYGPTCDSLDFMKGPFYLPKDIDEGDYIEIGQLGAYGRTMATMFNGFTAKKGVIKVSDEPLMTMYGDSNFGDDILEVIAA